ncbi:O-acetyl-ADP-ribose deacetylase [Bacillaceae bacterium]
MTFIRIKETVLEVMRGDITKCEVDVIVNAANSSLLGGGGVDGAIHRAGGKAILEECMQIRERQGGCPTGEAVITTAGDLPAKHVIHTVGPVWQGGDQGEAELLRSCYRNTLNLASAHQAKSIAFPNISTGVYRFPKELAAEIALDEVARYCREAEANTIRKVLFVCFDPENYRLYLEKIGRLA